MANFNGYGGFMNQPQFQSMYQAPVFQQQPAQQLDERIWVANEQAAESYLVAPNSFVRLWDSNKNQFYEKRSDASGRPMPIECYKYERITARQGMNESIATVDYQKQIDGLNGRIKAIEEALSNGKHDAENEPA